MELSNEAEDLKLPVIFLLSSTVAMNFQRGDTKMPYFKWKLATVKLNFLKCCFFFKHWLTGNCSLLILFLCKIQHGRNNITFSKPPLVYTSTAPLIVKEKTEGIFFFRKILFKPRSAIESGFRCHNTSDPKGVLGLSIQTTNLETWLAILCLVINKMQRIGEKKN